MNKSTIVLITLAALGIGSLIGVSLIDDDESPVVTGEALVVTGGAPVVRYLAPEDVTVEYDAAGTSLPVAAGENFIARGQPWKTETVVVEIPAGGKVEYKAEMSQGDVLVYRWQTDGGLLFCDFHGHDEAFGDGFFTRYSEGDSASDQGAIVAAYSGEHGWYWENDADRPVTVTLELAGFFDRIIKYDL